MVNDKLKNVVADFGCTVKDECSKKLGDIAKNREALFSTVKTELQTLVKVCRFEEAIDLAEFALLNEEEFKDVIGRHEFDFRSMDSSLYMRVDYPACSALNLISLSKDAG